MSRGDEVWSSNRRYICPDVRITEDRAEYVYVPLRGYSGTMPVFGLASDLAPIGWISSEALGFASVRDWMTATKWIDQGY